MLFADGFLGLALLCVWVFCVFEAITADPAKVRNLPKLMWVVLVVVLLDVGSLLWIVAGRPRRRYRPAPVPDALPPDDDTEFLAQLRARAEEQRRRARGDDPPPP